jgi:hypothetical protein
MKESSKSESIQYLTSLSLNNTKVFNNKVKLYDFN